MYNEFIVYEQIGKNIKKARIQNGLSQEKLSELLDTNSKYIGHIERVERFVSLKKLIQISEILNVPLTTLVEFNKQD